MRIKRLVIQFSLIAGLLVSSDLFGQGGGMAGFGSDSPWEEVDQGAENMDQQSVLQAQESKKANNRGGQGGSGGFATFNTNTQDVPIDDGIILISILIYGFLLFKLKQRIQLSNF